MHVEDRALLENVELFKGLSDAQIDAIAAATDIAWFDSGQPITEAEEAGAAAFVILEGSVMVADTSAPDGFQEPLGPGTFVGELAMLTEVSYAATVVAAEPVRALAITRATLYEVMEADPSIAEHFSAKLVRRLSSLADELRAVDDRFEALEISLQRIADAA
ncbi:Crp/Fnr family transcriptional regulator [Dichotomicrobium thermohalophilum]|uniref:Cyclic nucleotide-binding domain-containing protein n=1 Tax=Dichotomicrobium thermohalophilum TaxID=933063 RepID=A0A397Q372_9HYPH|nr:cyclic nucleotide-binding domain-containing protein [Dichotomicrobium thermohalophilum]RIA55970.1 Cyclic nucleotide-binding domain-containing protein [Dichotomicrobium thermohalophilum]